MNSRTFVVAVVVGAGLLTASCDRVKRFVGGGEPKGQVVATVEGEEITALQLRTELGNFSSTDPKIMKAAQQQALERIIVRKVLANAARQQKMDKSVDYTLQVERAQEALLSELYERKLTAETAPPSRAEAEAYVNAHPEMFANRKVLFVDQLIAAPNKIAPERLEPLKSLDEVKALLASEGVEYQENAAVLDSLTANPQLVKAVERLPAGEVFIIPQGGALVFNQITGARAAPFVGDRATTYAINSIRTQKAQENGGKKVADLRKAAEAKISYNPAYKPQPQKPAAAPTKTSTAVQ